MFISELVSRTCKEKLIICTVFAEVHIMCILQVQETLYQREQELSEQIETLRVWHVHVRVISHFPAVYEAAKPRVDRGK